MNQPAHVPIQIGGVAARGDVPVALLPVGIETRFSGDTLLIRVIPDEIHVEDHEPELTDSEAEAGQAFWTDVWHGGTAEPAATDHERAAWTRLVQAVGSSRRAAWIADQLMPIGGTRPAAPLPPEAALPDPPVIPVPPHRTGVWTHAAIARSLPDQFLAIAYRRTGIGGQVAYQELGRAFGARVADTIQLGFDPNAPPPPVTDAGPALPDAMRWLVDPAVAENAGLLIRLPLPAGTNRVDRLIVLGVLGSADAATSAARLVNLFVGHHHSNGLSLLPIGTASNNTEAERSGFSSPDDPAVSFGVERRTPAPAEGTDGALLAHALGIPAATFRGIEHAGDAEQAAAAQMNALIWPASIGYWLETLAQPGVSDAFIDQLRSHVVQMVRGRGPLPPIRVGQQPYGVLPVTSLTNWHPGPESAAVIRMVDMLRSTLPWWMDGVAYAPVVRAGADPDHGMLDMLGQSAVSSSVAVRSMVGANASYIPQPLFDGATGPGAEANRQRWMALLALRALGFTGLPYIAQLVAHTDEPPLFDLPYTVAPGRKPADAASDWNAVTTYLRALRSTRTADLQGQSPHSFTSLLTLLARRSVLLERLRVGASDTLGSIAGVLVEAHVRIDDPVVVQAQLVSTTATLRIGDTRSAAATLLASTVQQPDGSSLSMVDHLDRRLVFGPIDSPHYAETLAAAEAIANLSPERAAWLLGESLDIASHRFDAWVTSLATRRLSDMRNVTPTGITLGAYGAVEDLVRQQPRPVVDQPPAGAPAPLFKDAAGGGYVHAASLAQAATAAVLRAGHLAHAARDPNAHALAIDLSSSRVRTALGLLSGVREGQSLGALLGYRAERMLHEAGAHTAVEVVRRLAPPPVVTAPGTPEGLRPNAVCDGLALARMDRAAVLSAVQAVDATAVGAMTRVLDTLMDAADSVADLLLAESVHQIVRGNPNRAAGALDTLNRGEGAIADPEIVRTPRTGTSVTHRTMLLLASDAPPAPGWPIDGVRAQAEPRLAAWAGFVLGDPTGVSVTVHAGGADTVLPLSDLQLGALDVVYEPLMPRVLRYARARGIPDPITVDVSAAPIAGLLGVADNIHTLLSRARAATGTDLARPQDRGSVISGPLPVEGSSAASRLTTTLPDVDHGDRQTRLAAARAQLSGAINALSQIAPGGVAPVAGDLVGPLDILAAFGIALGGDPTEPPSIDALIGVRNAAQARLTTSNNAPTDPVALFGDGFAVLALAAPPTPDALTGALNADPLAATSSTVLALYGGRDGVLTSWIESYGRTRGTVGRLADVLLAARLRGTAAAAPFSLRCLQMPNEPFPTADPSVRGSWIGMPFPTQIGPDPVTSIVAHVLGTPDVARGIAGLVIDEFVETLPARETTSALSFGFEAPAARPPQSILLAVPAVPGAAWTMDGLAGVIGETLDLAKIRMVDLSALAWAGRFLPAIYLTDGDVTTGLDLPMKDLVQFARAQSQVWAHQ